MPVKWVEVILRRGGVKETPFPIPSSLLWFVNGCEKKKKIEKKVNFKCNLNLTHKFESWRHGIISPFLYKHLHFFVYVQFIFSFCQENDCSFILSSFLFSILTIDYVRLFRKIVYVIRFLLLHFLRLFLRLLLHLFISVCFINLQKFTLSLPMNK